MCTHYYLHRHIIWHNTLFYFLIEFPRIYIFNLPKTIQLIMLKVIWSFVDYYILKKKSCVCYLSSLLNTWSELNTEWVLKKKCLIRSECIHISPYARDFAEFLRRLSRALRSWSTTQHQPYGIIWLARADEPSRIINKLV